MPLDAPSCERLLEVAPPPLSFCLMCLRHSRPLWSSVSTGLSVHPSILHTRREHLQGARWLLGARGQGGGSLAPPPLAPGGRSCSMRLASNRANICSQVCKHHYTRACSVRHRGGGDGWGQGLVSRYKILQFVGLTRHRYLESDRATGAGLKVSRACRQLGALPWPEPTAI